MPTVVKNVSSEWSFLLSKKLKRALKISKLLVTESEILFSSGQ